MFHIDPISAEVRVRGEVRRQGRQGEYGNFPSQGKDLRFSHLNYLADLAGCQKGQNNQSLVERTKP